jgi:ribonuclease P/MRP protein subunit POP8
MTSTIDNSPNLPTGSTPSKRKSPEETDASKASPSSKVLTFTSRNPPWTYLKLQLYALHPPLHTCILTQSTRRITQPPTSTSQPPLDPLTAKTHLTAALAQFLGLTGTAIPLDILKIAREDQAQTQAVWIRVPRSDAAAVVAALSSWIGGPAGGGNKSATAAATGGSVAWRVCAKGNYLGAVVHGSGGDLFVP